MNDLARMHDDAVNALDPTTSQLYGVLRRRWDEREIDSSFPTVAIAYTAEIFDAVPTLPHGVLDDALTKLERSSLITIRSRDAREGTGEVEAIEYELPLWATLKG